MEFASRLLEFLAKNCMLSRLMHHRCKFQDITVVVVNPCYALVMHGLFIETMIIGLLLIL